MQSKQQCLNQATSSNPPIVAAEAVSGVEVGTNFLGFGALVTPSGSTKHSTVHSWITVNYVSEKVFSPC